MDCVAFDDNSAVIKRGHVGTHIAGVTVLGTGARSLDDDNR
jgi:hypothetical protein